MASEIEASLVEELSGGRPRLVALKLATLLHDIGKPATKTTEATGRARFYGHAELGARMATEATERLRFSRREVDTVKFLVEEHMRPTQMGHPPSDRALYRFFRYLGDHAYALLLLHLGDALATRGPSIDSLAVERMMRRVGDILRWRFSAPPVAQRRLINGHDLIDALSLSPGPLVGRLLEALEEAHALGKVNTREEALAYAASLLQGEVLTGAPREAKT
jgi:putative nucleotidyltransferase with HDIG domain